ncbi:hypothetical protein ACGH7X_40450 [Streptomyces sp. BBFR51]
MATFVTVPIDWAGPSSSGRPPGRTQDSEHLLETTGKELRKLMSWVDEEA